MRLYVPPYDKNKAKVGYAEKIAKEGFESF
jgi:hypothetical protein